MKLGTLLHTIIYQVSGGKQLSLSASEEDASFPTVYHNNPLGGKEHHC